MVKNTRTRKQERVDRALKLLQLQGITFQSAIWVVLSRCLVHTASSQGGLHFVPRYHSRDGRRVDRNELAGNSVGQKSYAVAVVTHV